MFKVSELTYLMALRTSKKHPVHYKTNQLCDENYISVKTQYIQLWSSPLVFKHFGIHLSAEKYKRFSTTLDYVPNCSHDNFLVSSVDLHHKFVNCLQKKLLIFLLIHIFLFCLSVPDLLDNPSLHLVPMTGVVRKVLKCNVLCTIIPV